MSGDITAATQPRRAARGARPHGTRGARPKVTPRTLSHCFGSKERLDLAVLGAVDANGRSGGRDLDLDEGAVEALRRLTSFMDLIAIDREGISGCPAKLSSTTSR